eukprot:780411-Rhodomonas_salina.1
MPPFLLGVRPLLLRQTCRFSRLTRVSVRRLQLEVEMLRAMDDKSLGVEVPTPPRLLSARYLSRERVSFLLERLIADAVRREVRYFRRVSPMHISLRAYAISYAYLPRCARGSTLYRGRDADEEDSEGDAGEGSGRGGASSPWALRRSSSATPRLSPRRLPSERAWARQRGEGEPRRSLECQRSACAASGSLSLSLFYEQLQMMPSYSAAIWWGKEEQEEEGKRHLRSFGVHGGGVCECVLVSSGFAARLGGGGGGGGGSSSSSSSR